MKLPLPLIGLVSILSLKAETTKLLAPDGVALDRFGSSVAASDSYLIIASPRDDDKGSNSGSVYVFDSQSRKFLHKITAEDGAPGDEFGCAVATHGDLAIIGARFNDDKANNAGAAYIYNLRTSSLVQKITASDASSGDQFGKAVSIHGGHIAVTSWLADAKGGNDSGKAYLFDSEGTEILQFEAFDGQKFDQFGASIDINAQHVIIGAPFEDQSGADSGSVYIYEIETGTVIHKFISPNGGAGDVFGASVSIDGVHALVGASRANTSQTSSGAAYLFNIDVGELVQTFSAPNPEENDRFGVSVDMNTEFILIGSDSTDLTSNETGSALIYQRSSGKYLKTLIPSDINRADFLGGSVALHGPQALVASVQDDDNGSSSGSAYVFQFVSPVRGLTIRKDNQVLKLNWNSLGEGSRYRIMSSTDLKNWDLVADDYVGTAYEFPFEPQIHRCFFKVEEGF